MPAYDFTSETMLKRLIAYDTTSHLSNLDLMGFVQELLEHHGIQSQLIYNEEKTKANLHAIIGRTDVPGIILSGHTDVVPVADQNWSSDPFELTEKDDIYYGRGTCDMKGFIAVVLGKLPKITSASLKTPLHLAFSYDEEIGCVGVRDMVDVIANDLEVRPKMCLVGEPTSMQVINGHKAINRVKCDIAGHECHSSLAPYGVNAVEMGGELISYIRKLARRFQHEGPFNMEYDPPYTTLNAGVFHGGTAVNIVPNKGALDFEMRSIPEHDPEEIINEIRDYAYRILEPQMKDKDPNAGFTFDQSVSTPGLSTPNDAEVVKLAQNLSGENSTHKVSFATEAGLFQHSGIPTVVCGPGSIEQAHKPDEFVTKDQLIKCERFIDGLIEHATR